MQQIRGDPYATAIGNGDKGTDQIEIEVSNHRRIMPRNASNQHY
jgi:hypothetical protein